MIKSGGEAFYFPGGSVGCLLVHGFVSAPQEMYWLGRRLNQANFTVLGVRLHGHATQPSDLYHVHRRDWIASIEDGYHMLTDQCENIVIVGMSLGGVLALLLSSYLPFDCVIPVSTPFQTIPYSKLSFLRPALLGLRFLRGVIRKIPKPPPLDFIDRQAAEDHLTYSWLPTQGILEIDKLFQEMRDALPMLDLPVLIIHSFTDRGVPIENAKRMAQRIGSDQVATLYLERSGHVILLEPQREYAAEAMIEFIRKSTMEEELDAEAR